MNRTRETLAVVGVYAVLAVVMTWPLASVLPREIAGDLGDPLFNSYVLLWTSGQVLRALGGDLSAIAQYWHGNIFYPAPFAIAHSEHLLPQMLQALPVIAATHNVVLAYNLLLLAMFVLSALGAYLFVRDLTGRPLAAFVAGVAFAFAPFRLDQWAHLDVLSSEWMPFALYGLRRFAVTGRVRALAGATAAVVLQAWSCLYYLAFFTPFAAAYGLYELWAHGRLRERRMWIAVASAAATAALVVGAFLWPYVVVRRGVEHHQRPMEEVQDYAADTHAFATMSDRSRLLASVVRALPKNEGQGFPGFTILTLAAIGVGAAIARAVRGARSGADGWRRVLAWTIGAALVVYFALLLHLLVTGTGTVTVFGLTLRMRYRPERLLLQLLALVAGLLLVSPRIRGAVRSFHRVPEAFLAWAALVAAMLSLGPMIYVGGRELGPGLYSLVYRLPGFDAFRVVSLYFMPMALFLAVLAGFGVAAFTATRASRVVTVLAAFAILAESWMVPVETHAPPEIAVHGVAAEPAGVYRWIRDQPARMVVLELPFGAVFNEAGYTFAAGYHRKPTVNGYSGFFPRAYELLKLELKEQTPRSWSALRASGATHVVFHGNRYPDFVASDRVSRWLRENGAQQVAAFGDDRVFALP